MVVVVAVAGIITTATATGVVAAGCVVVGTTTGIAVAGVVVVAVASTEAATTKVASENITD